MVPLKPKRQGSIKCLTRRITCIQIQTLFRQFVLSLRLGCLPILALEILLPKIAKLSVTCFHHELTKHKGLIWHKQTLTSVNNVITRSTTDCFFFLQKELSVEPSDSTVLNCKTGRVIFKANQLCNYRLKLFLGIERFR